MHSKILEDFHNQCNEMETKEAAAIAWSFSLLHMRKMLILPCWKCTKASSWHAEAVLDVWIHQLAPSSIQTWNKYLDSVCGLASCMPGTTAHTWNNKPRLCFCQDNRDGFFFPTVKYKLREETTGIIQTNLCQEGPSLTPAPLTKFLKGNKF